MTRRHRPPSIRSLSAAMSLVWLLGGCAVQVESASPYAPPDTGEAVSAYTDLGLAYLRRDNLSRARRALEHALELGPHDPQALEGMALLHQRQKEPALAEEFFERALEADTDYTRARNNYAALLYDEGKLDAACRQLRIAAQDMTYDNRAQLLANLGRCRFEQGDLEAARRPLEQALAYDSRDTQSLLLLARLDHTQGHDERAWERLQRFFTLADATPDSLELASEIARARGDQEAAAFYHRQLDGS
ncbi:type IV pilus biogenesis/stability protein PilW [Chromohalobacter israelensis]|uniref:type IV pilus biogenesis/stability protein PilW n=1 Tax=Chromohalobacter israelensis TaxID=141390 RepID=UPI00265C0042|nr:type IV pilus biogenesis/stability protein PilW [Chromohalobacter salexigens]MDO0946062.1 type IV pilus biogenesis/stability protein PilW [Chromohalobacter salexigens]